MTLDDLPTPCLVLDLGILKRNLAAMQAAVARHPGLILRPHLKTAKSRDVARLAAPDFGPVTVSTLAEARYFAEGGWRDQVYAVGITPQKLDAVASLNTAHGADIKVITDDPDVARAIAAHPRPLSALVEVDVGEARGGVAHDSPMLAEIAAALGPRLAGLLSHSGHSYAGRSVEDMAQIAEEERLRILAAADRLRAAGHVLPIISVGSSPTALHARDMRGITEVRAGVYMFGDLFQAQLARMPRRTSRSPCSPPSSAGGPTATPCCWMPARWRCRRTAPPRRRRATTASAWCWTRTGGRCRASPSSAAPTRNMARCSPLHRCPSTGCRSAPGCAWRRTTPA